MTKDRMVYDYSAEWTADAPEDDDAMDHFYEALYGTWESLKGNDCYEGASYEHFQQVHHAVLTEMLPEMRDGMMLSELRDKVAAKVKEALASEAWLG